MGGPGKFWRGYGSLIVTLLAVLAVCGMSHHYHWAGGMFSDRVFGRFGLAIGISSAVMLAGYLISLLLSIRAANQPGGDRSAPGCLSFMAMIAAVMLAALLVGLFFRLGPLIKLVSVLTIVPFVLVLLNVAFEKIRDRWRGMK